MNTVDYTRLSTDALVQQFVHTAKQAGTVYGLDRRALVQSIVALGSRQSDARIAEMQALGAELRRRRPVAQLRQLFEHEDPDVRGWAGSQFLSVDYDWASAAMTGLSYGLGTREVLAWRDRILRGPPSRPALKEVSVAQLVDRFIDACERCYGSTRFLTDEQGGGADRRAYNKGSGEPYAVGKELRARGELAALLPLLDHPLVSVREKASLCCLNIATAKAVATLEAIRGVDARHEAAEGSIMLSLWRMGKLDPLS